MPSYVVIALALFGLYASTFVYTFILNYLHARKSNLPYVCVPWDQNHLFWMLASVPSRPFLKKHLPTWIWERLSLTVYAFEFTEKLRPFTQYAAPQGNDKTYVLVSMGYFEISTRDPEIAWEILSSQRSKTGFIQHDLIKVFMSRFGPNVLTSDGEAWARQRKVVASSITERISKRVFEESLRQVEGLLEEVFLLDGCGGGGGGDESRCETERLFDGMKKITINVLSSAGMGESVEWKDEKNSSPEPGFRMTYIQAVNAVIDAVAGPLVLPKWFLSYYPTFLPGGEFLRTVGYAIEEFPIHTKALLERENKKSALEGKTRSNIMSQLLRASESETKDGVRTLSDEEMMGNLFIFTAAGFDTNANALSYALVLLARYPQWQEWISEEIDAIIPAEMSIAEMDYASIIPKATRTLATMLETLRLFPPAIHMAKQTKVEQTITTSRGTFWIPANATVYINNIGLGRDPEVWRNLNLKDGETSNEVDDETVFRPSRWINADGGLFQPPRGTFSPWSSGPRICPGMKMAQVEFTSIFLMLLRRHRIEAVAMCKSANGEVENRREVEKRLDQSIEDSIAILTLQLPNVYDQKKGEGIKLAVVKR